MTRDGFGGGEARRKREGKKMRKRDDKSEAGNGHESGRNGEEEKEGILRMGCGVD
jgi:hypothetical protein